jgi:hypothetical protein
MKLNRLPVPASRAKTSPLDGYLAIVSRTLAL